MRTIEYHDAALRVRYAETDQMGVVYHANYLIWFEVGRVELMRAMGFEYKSMETEDDCHIVVVEAHCRYEKPARYDQTLRVRTRIAESGRNRPERYGPTQAPDPATPAGMVAAQIQGLVQSGLDPSLVAARVLTAIREDELYAFTHPQMRGDVEARFATILAAMDKAASC